MTFERTVDYDLVRGIMTLPQIYPWISDDGSPPAAEYRPVESDAVWYILALEEGQLLGLWQLVPVNAIEYEVHTCLLPHHGYRKARQAAREGIAWVWAHVPARRLMTKVPAFNRLAYRFALEAGFEVFGIDRKSYLKNGQLYDQALLGLSPE